MPITKLSNSGGVFALFLAFAFLLFVSGCDDSVADSDDSGNPNGGDVDLESFDKASGVVSLQVEPPGESGYQIQQVIGIDLDSFGGEIKLKASHQFSGEIVTSSGLPLEAYITLVRTDINEMILGRPLPNVTTSTNEMTGNSYKTTFAMSVLEAEYSLFVYPKDSGFAPPYVKPAWSKFTQNINQQIVFEESNLLEGRVFDNAINPIAGAKVVAFSSSSGEWMRSSIEYASEDGSFSLKLPKVDGVYSIRVEKGKDSKLIPSLYLGDVITVNEGRITRKDLTKTNDGIVSIVYDSFNADPCTLSGIVHAPSSGSNLAPLPNATLRFVNHTGGGEVSVNTITDNKGQFSIDLLKTNPDEASDDYSVTIIPATDSGGSIKRVFNIDCSDWNVSKDFNLDKKIKISGKVTDKDGKALEAVKIEARKQPTKDDTITYVKPTLSGTDGRYSIDVDPGTYDLMYIPAEQSGLARAFLREIQTSTDIEADQTLNPGSIFKGKILGPDGSPVPWVYIQVFRERPVSLIAEPIGSGSTDESGEFAIIVP